MNETIYSVFININGEMEIEHYSHFEEMYYIFSGTEEECKIYIEKHKDLFHSYSEFNEYIKSQCSYELGAMCRYNSEFRRMIYNEGLL